MSGRRRYVWGLLWRSENWLDGKRRHLLKANGVPVLFPIRQDARDFANEYYGYIRARPDLQREPHGWQMPVPVKVAVSYEDDDE